jgi:hypothetical protein
MSNLSTEDWIRRKNLLDKSKTKQLNSDEMAELTILNAKLYGMVGFKP